MIYEINFCIILKLPEYFDIIKILGEEVHSILVRKYSVAVGLKREKNRLDKFSISV